MQTNRSKNEKDWKSGNSFAPSDEIKRSREKEKVRSSQSWFRVRVCSFLFLERWQGLTLDDHSPIVNEKRRISVRNIVKKARESPNPTHHRQVRSYSKRDFNTFIFCDWQTLTETIYQSGNDWLIVNTLFLYYHSRIHQQCTEEPHDSNNARTIL